LAALLLGYNDEALKMAIAAKEFVEVTCSG